MKCPYHDCQKDYNPEWGNERTTVSPTRNCDKGDGLWIETSTCKFCEREFHEIYRAQLKKNQHSNSWSTVRKELLFTFPSTKTKFEAKKIPKNVKDSFNEAECCKSIGSLTGIGSCLRKTIYMICDEQKTRGRDYREKIDNLPVKGKYQALLRQIKWLGDKTTKPGDEKYSMDDANLALEILPILIEEIYAKDEKIEEAEKILAKVKSKK